MKGYVLLAVAATVIIGYCVWKNYCQPKTEEYGIALGMLAPQNYFYAKCTNDCVRDKTGDTAPGQFQWLCTDKCAEIAKAREVQGVPDISRENYQRYMENHVPGTYWSSEYLESGYCMKDITKWCAERYCPFSNLQNCMPDCIKMKGVDCGGAVVGGWMP